MSILVFDVKFMASAAGVSQSAVRQAVKRGSIKAIVTKSGKTFVPIAEALAYLKARRLRRERARARRAAA
jgi:hypothetical protein